MTCRAHLGEAVDVYPRLDPGYTLIVSDGAYGIGGFPGDPTSPRKLADWYAPHLAASSSLYFWGTPEGCARTRPDPGAARRMRAEEIRLRCPRRAPNGRFLSFVACAQPEFGALCAYCGEPKHRHGHGQPGDALTARAHEREALYRDVLGAITADRYGPLGALARAALSAEGVAMESTHYVAHSPYPDGSWRGIEKCAHDTWGALASWETREEAEAWIEGCPGNPDRWVVVEIVLSYPNVRAALPVSRAKR